MAHEPWHVDVGAMSGSGLGTPPGLLNTAADFVSTGLGLDPNSPLAVTSGQRLHKAVEVVTSLVTF